jgi:hypothetical protein
VVNPAIQEQILQDLSRLSSQQQQQAADFVHGLASAPPKGASFQDLKAVVGTLDDEAAKEMMDAIEEGCGQIEPDGW